MSGEAVRAFPQAVQVANFYALATLSASTYTQLVPAKGERSKGVWIQNLCVSSTGTAYLYPNQSATSDLLAWKIEAGTGGNPLSIVFIPGTGAIFVKSVTPAILANLVAMEF